MNERRHRQAGCARRVAAVALAVLACGVFAQAAGAGTAGVQAGGPQLLDRVIAVVSGTVITLSDARVALAFGFVDPGSAADPVEPALRWLVDRQLVLDEAARSGAGDVDAAELRREAALVRQRFPSEAAYREALDRLGLDDRRAETVVRDTLVARQYVERRFDAVLPPTEEELRDYYDSHRDRFMRNGRQLTYDEAASDARGMAEQDRREQAITSWMDRLRRRAEITDVYRQLR